VKSFLEHTQTVIALLGEGKEEAAQEYLKQNITGDEEVVALLKEVEPLFLKQARPLAEAQFLLVLNQAFPGHFPVVMLLGKLMQQLGDQAAALKCFRFACKLNPGNGESFTRSLLLQIPNKQEPQAVHDTGKDIIGMPLLGGNGRFANQLFQYSFGLCYASRFGMELQVPDWVGRHFFQLDDCFISQPLPGKQCDCAEVEALLASDTADLSNMHVAGYFNRHSAVYAPYRDLLRQAFVPRGLFGEAWKQFQSWLRREEGPLVTIHLRRGDFGYDSFWIAEDAWYLAWLEEYYAKKPNAVLYIATDDASTREAFARYQPKVLADSGIDFGDFNFFLDFLALTEADALGISNSTFSFFASMLNTQADCFMRPDRESRQMIPYEPWNAAVTL